MYRGIACRLHIYARVAYHITVMALDACLPENHIHQSRIWLERYSLAVAADLDKVYRGEEFSDQLLRPGLEFIRCNGQMSAVALQIAE